MDPQAILNHPCLTMGENVFIADRVVINQAQGAGAVDLGDRVHLLRDTVIATGDGGAISIGADTYIQPRCQIMGYKGPIRIGCGVQIAPHCALYSYNHRFEPGEFIRLQPLTTKGGITVGDDAWLGFGVIVLDGVRIGRGAVIGAGSVVTRDIPDHAIAAGVPARVIRMRGEGVSRMDPEGARER
ncbi:MAG: acyltransferase [Nitrospirota bacterium]